MSNFSFAFEFGDITFSCSDFLLSIEKKKKGRKEEKEKSENGSHNRTTV